jgi:hypothetical protein
MQYKRVHEYFERMSMSKNEIYSMLAEFQYGFYLFIVFVVSDEQTEGIEGLLYVKFCTRRHRRSISDLAKTWTFKDMLL